MGRIDIITNEYMSDNDRFADLFNFFLYNGKQVILPDMLREMDRTALALPYGDERNSSEAVQKYRDVFKLLAAMEDDKASYILLGVEDQASVHYAMPVRNMFYDATQYVKQVEDTTKRHRKKKNENRRSEEIPGNEKESRSSAEFLSGFYKEDRLTPVITLVVYWSPDKWDGPHSIHEMLTTDDEEILGFIPDYKINLLELGSIKDIDFKKFRTSLAEAFQFIKYSKDKKRLETIVSENDEFTHLDRRTVEVINSVTKLDLEITENKEEVNMCLAIEQMKEEAREEVRKSMCLAIEQMKEEAREEGQNEIIGKMLRKGKSAEEISELLDIPLEKVKKVGEKNLTIV